jgi:hypothetical protein
MKNLTGTHQYRGIFEFKCIDRRKIVRIERFTDEASGWSHSEEKIDAIEFKSTDDFILQGYIQF